MRRDKRKRREEKQGVNKMALPTERGPLERLYRGICGVLWARGRRRDSLSETCAGEADEARAGGK